MKHIASVDKEEGTVIMIQIENEIGMLEDARDYSKEADKLFYAPVPSLFIDYLQRTRDLCIPKCWQNGRARDSRRKVRGRKCLVQTCIRMKFLWPGRMRSM